jgi:hypothetical protein
VNEGFETAPDAAMDRYVANTRLLMSRVRDLGAIPVNITMYPYAKYGDAHLALIGKLTRMLEEWGWPLFNFWSPVATESGRWIPFLSADGLHPLDAGHQALYDAIPDSAFGRLLEQDATDPQPEASGSGRAAETAGVETALRVSPSRALASWTIAAHLRDPALGEETRLFSVAGDVPVRLWRRFNRLELWAGEDLVLVRAEPPAGWHHFALSYQSLTGRIVLAIDGEIWGEAAAPPRNKAGDVEIASACPACRVANVALYRTNLLSGELRWLASQSVLRRSLDAWAPINTDPAAGVNLNAAETMTRVEVRGEWVLDAEDLPPQCVTVSPERPVDRGEKQ